MKINNVAVIGTGTMGNGIAHVFALSGFKVKIVGMSEELNQDALTRINSNLLRQVKKNLITEAVMQAALSNIHSYISIQDGVSNADLIVEAVPEDEAVKRSVFQQIDQYAPVHAILASNTSSLPITRIGSFTSRSEKVIGMHFMNPVPLMSLVEVIRGFNTSDETNDSIKDITLKLGKTPVEVNDYPGFVANRILMPMINEAIYTLFEGVASVQEIDSVMKLGMAHPMGPLQLADFIGLDVCNSILNVLYQDFKNPKYAPCPLLQKMVQSGNLGTKTGKGFYDYSNKVTELVVADYFRK
jgi:3-hydroxybutyryl-CoA dehydrogenase